MFRVPRRLSARMGIGRTAAAPMPVACRGRATGATTPAAAPVYRMSMVYCHHHKTIQ
ncbi:MAG: hypothetical protein ACP5MJ_00505 [Roseiflexus sp.]